ncbi:ABC transporter ATP-binding protein [Falsochrobactrum sp. TDYN1]|uniref:ABC transporter ATP-binding protein n=1 Tax=Falsochrobactrum tianjinense TaxID=2706015 RepID=A0A949PN39_9HYPH|nr:ABC transporter ATP-binding protein [Falsochrobactrum sp. TDYN1]MBV2143793.1 ABC transporter ATP-binding protein [Falsochrobactrum sp. TDYN1]
MRNTITAAQAADVLEKILDVKDLNINFQTHDGVVQAVRGINISVQQGETLAIVGESGSGKSQTMMGIMGLLASNGRITGSAIYRGDELIGASDLQLNKIRGAKISMIFQEPMTSLDPLYRIGYQIAEVIAYHKGSKIKNTHRQVLDLLEMVGIPEPERRIDSYPHELSGGQRQRVMIAMALANNPDILIADEPTTALDVTVQAAILELLLSLQRRFGMAIILITHDLAVVRHFAERVVVMKSGKIVEEGATEEVFVRPQTAYTKMLVDSEPSGHKEPQPLSSPVIVDARNIFVDYGSRQKSFLGGFNKIFRAVDDVSIQLRQGQTIGIVGESGSGKSTIARALARLIRSEGEILFNGQDISQLNKCAMLPVRKNLQMVFQDPYGSLSPRLTIGEIIGEGLKIHDPALTKAARYARVGEALREVGMDETLINRYPHEFSGGQRQRIAIARAIIIKPSVVILDEPTSALDRTVQRQVIDLLRRIQCEHNLSYIFISHDLTVIRALADYVMVMKQGQVVEQGDTEMVFRQPQHDYTKTLISSALNLKTAQFH